MTPEVVTSTSVALTWPDVALALINAIPGLLAALGTLLVLTRMNDVSTKIQRVEDVGNVTHKLVNDHMTKLIDFTRERALAEGKTIGKAEEKATAEEMAAKMEVMVEEKREGKD